MNANFISGQLRILQEHLAGARKALKGDNVDTKRPWHEESADESVRHAYPLSILLRHSRSNYK
jgi:hypothetical protein